MREQIPEITRKEIKELIPQRVLEVLDEEAVRLKEELLDKIHYAKGIRLAYEPAGQALKKISPDPAWNRMGSGAGYGGYSLSKIESDETARQIFAYQLQNESLLNGVCGMKIRTGKEYESALLFLRRKASKKLIEEYEPKGMISIERCGRNKYGTYANMRGEDIGAFTAPIDEMFIKYQGIIPTIGVGDGGNEIGMGKIAGPISRKLSLEPCVVPVDIFVIASVSNWGAYGIVAALARLCRMELVPKFEWVETFIKKTVNIGSVDGITGWQSISVDGKNMRTEYEILHALRKIGRKAINVYA